MYETIKEILINTIEFFKNEFIISIIEVSKFIINCIFSNGFIKIIILLEIGNIINNNRKRKNK